MKNNLIAIVIFSYKRPDKLQKLIQDLLSQNYDISQIPVILFQDNTNDLRNLPLVRNCINNFQSSKIPIKILRLRDKNFGLKNNVESGLSEVFKSYSKAIVLEDDLRLSKTFVETLLDLLNDYEEDKSICSVTGMGIEGFERKSRIRSKLTSSIGWGTWSDRWQKRTLNPLIILWFIFVKGRKIYDMNFLYPYSTMFLSTLFKQTSSWAIYWYSNSRINNLYTIYSKYFLCAHDGGDGSGTNFFDEVTTNLNCKLSNKIEDSQEKIDVLNKSFDVYLCQTYNLKSISIISSLIYIFKRYFQNYIKKII